MDFFRNIVIVQGNKHRFVHADHLIHDDSSPRQITNTNDHYAESISNDYPVESDSCPPPSTPEGPLPATNSVPDLESPWVDQSDQTRAHIPDLPSTEGDSTVDSAVPGTRTTRSGRVIKPPTRLNL